MRIFTILCFILLTASSVIAENQRGLTVQEKKPGELSDKSELHKKETGQIKKMEEKAATLRQKELAEITGKQAELDEIDRQITAMKSRLAGGAARTNDRVEAIAAMTGYKAEHVKKLEELRNQHESEEYARQQQIGKLKREVSEKWIAEINADVDRYQQIVTNKFTKYMKDSAWDALITAYPEVKEVKRHDLGSFRSKLGLDHDPGLDQSCYTDPQTALMWVKNGHVAGRSMNWQDAMNWASALYYCGYSDWRLPASEELSVFAKRVGNRKTGFPNVNGFNNISTGGYWSSTTHDNNNGNAWIVNISDGSMNNFGKNLNNYVWPVRDVK